VRGREEKKKLLSNLISQLRSDPVAALASMLISIPAILIALTLHEIAHGYVAKRCGDPTAEMLGRLSLNPLHHMDQIGTLCMLIFGFGWAKPVPINPRNFKNYRRDDLLVSLAGITVNLLLFFFATLLMTGLNQIIFTEKALQTYGASTFLSMKYSGFWNVYAGSVDYLVSMGLVRVPWLLYVQRFLCVFSLLNLGLGIFNLFPIPPLDGYHVVNDILLKGRLQLSQQAFWICQLAVLALCYFGVLSSLMNTIMDFVQNGVVSFFILIFNLPRGLI